MLGLTMVVQGREPPVCFAPDMENTDTARLARCEAVLDQTVFPILTFSNTPVSDALGYLVDASPQFNPHGGLSIIFNIRSIPQPEKMLLPPTPETITLSLTNATYRQALNEICQHANLSWRLSLLSILVARPEHFVESDKKKSIEPAR